MGRLLLWDIDGTLLDNGGSNRAALYAAVNSVLGREVEEVKLETAGKTDPEIARELLTGAGVSDDDMTVTMRSVLRKFGPEMAKQKRLLIERGGVYVGVHEVLQAIAETRTVNTVLTGNIAVNAIFKLDAFRLTPYFDLEVGAFGSDREMRNELVDVAVTRAADKRRAYFDDDEIWIIGDTPLDYEVARTNHTRCLLVATGRSPYQELENLGADLVVEDLTDTQRILELLSPESK
jgi:phosphoglycolate phosphatase